MYELNDPALVQVAERARVLLIGMRGSRHPAQLARQLGIDEVALGAFVAGGAEKRVEPAFLASLLVAVIGDEGADPEWLFTGNYSSPEAASDRSKLKTMSELRVYVEQRLARLTQASGETGAKSREAH